MLPLLFLLNYTSLPAFCSPVHSEIPTLSNLRMMTKLLFFSFFFFDRAAHLLGFIHSCLLQPTLLFCWLLSCSAGAAGHLVALLKQRRKLTADKKRECIVQVTRVFSFSIFVRQNVIRWNCTCSMTLHFKLFHGSIFPSCSPRKFQGRNQGRAGRRESEGAILL